MSVLLQLWGGFFYLLNKIFLSIAERVERRDPDEQKWRILSWIVFLIGTPAWIVLFIHERNWIAASLEAGGIPSMAIGIIIALKGRGREPKWLKAIAIISIVVGLAYSWYDFSGIRTLRQFVEIVMMGAYLIGAYQLAHKKLSGYVWFMLMNVACIALMYLEDHPGLIIQQIISVGFVINAYMVKKK